MKNKLFLSADRLLMPVLRAMLFLRIFTACAQKPEYGKVMKIGEDDRAAVEIINIYENFSQGREFDGDLYDGEGSHLFDLNYYQIKPFMYGLLDSKGYPKAESGDAYSFGNPRFSRVGNRFFCTALPVESQDGFENIYNSYSAPLDYKDSLISLSPVGKVYYETGEVVYTFERVYNSNILSYVDYTLVPYKLEDVEDIISDLGYKKGDTLYRIKKVKERPYTSEEEPTVVEISTPEELVEMSADYRTNGCNYSNYLFVLTEDIDMRGVMNFVPIGSNYMGVNDPRFTSVNGFSSKFDGRGHTIKNLKLKRSLPNQIFGNRLLALFNIIGPKGEVKNLNLENFSIDIPENLGLDYTCAGFAGTISGRVCNCNVQGSIRNPEGGGAGFTYNIVGYSDTLIENCTADVDIAGCSNLAGFVTYSYQRGGQKDACLTLSNCASYGSLTAERYPSMPETYEVGQIGGFIFDADNGIFENCHAQTNIILNSTSKYVGAFAGNIDRDPISGQFPQFVNCSYSPVTSGNNYAIGMIIWTSSKGDYQGAEFTQRSISLKEWKEGLQG